MAGSLSNYTEELCLNTLRGNALTSPTNLYLALFTNDPTDAATGTEVTGSGYARKVITSFTTPSTVASVTTISNAADIEFAAATGTWGTVTHAAIFDALTGGNMIAHCALTNSKYIESTDIMKVLDGELDLSLSGGISQYLKEAWLNTIFKGAAFTTISAIYAALFTTNPTDAGTGTEVSGNNYARKAITLSAPSQVSGKATSSNSAKISFNQASGSWGTVAYQGLYDATTAGHLLMFAALGTPKTVNNGDIVESSIGQFVYTLE